ncbi:hypothetical protein M422DRAFT_272174 [Sphaerobolus stellatus SS14]|uniref:non-specific serine/threonine protein kinase n=1 Tax=Sphaerobolus stellatus (strain SS14) TaxID=990650 RepID=A0A0C9UN41_SPHS4|nr:hypothetical protein M422DRAFT_272174 [Sphaerobolus stellatus SS14]
MTSVSQSLLDPLASIEELVHQDMAAGQGARFLFDILYTKDRNLAASPTNPLPPSISLINAIPSRYSWIQKARYKDPCNKCMLVPDASRNPPGLDFPHSGSYMHVDGSIVRYFTPNDVVLLAEIGYGANGHISSCRLRTSEGVTIRGLWAVKRMKNTEVLERECRTMEALRRLAPESMVPYLGRYYEENVSFTTTSTSCSPNPGLNLSGYLMVYMEYSDFFDLLCRLQEPSNGPRRALHPHVARWYAIDILNRLYGLHVNSYYHGDVKSENLMMAVDGHIVFADFGETRKDIPENWNVPNLGTLTTQAPELYENWKGPRRPSDLWSVGVIIFDMLFGYMPFEGRSINEVYDSMHEVIDYELWPTIMDGDIFGKERELGLDFVKRLLVPTVFNRMWWPELRTHPWVKDEWKTISEKQREAPMIIRRGTWEPGMGWASLLKTEQPVYSSVIPDLDL